MMSNLNIQSIINDIIQANNQYKSGERNETKFHISDAGGCYRARIYKRMGVKPTREIEIEGLRKMVAGDAGHEKLQQLLYRGKKLFLSESEVETDQIIGHPDGVIKSEDNKWLVEFKTVEKWSMGWIKKQGAKREHMLQMFTYWSLLRRDLSGLDKAVLSYVKREDFETHDFYFIWSDQIQADVDAEWNPLLKHWEEKTLPPCTCKDMYDGSGPKYCRFLKSWDDTTKTGVCCEESLFIQK